MKVVVVIGDGMADRPGERGRTPLMEAHHPNMDEVASRGLVGAVDPVPAGMEPSSDIAMMGLMGYDPSTHYTGRGPIEAAGIGVELGEGDVALRCNLVTVEEGRLVDYSADHIDSSEAGELIRFLDGRLHEGGRVGLYVGVSYRHLMVLRGGYSDRVLCTPPHEAVGRRVVEVMPTPLDGEGEPTARLLRRLMERSYELLAGHPINLDRVRRGLKPANMVWPWGLGRRPRLPPFSERYGLSSAVISAVSVVKGLGRLAGMRVVDVPGATGYLDTNYEGKADYALRALEEGADVVYVHVEAPDEAGHQGSFELKVKAIEDLDRRLLGRLLDRAPDDLVVAVLSDHMTPVADRVHVKGPVPYAVAMTSGPIRERRAYDERLAWGVKPLTGPELLNLVLRLAGGKRGA